MTTPEASGERREMPAGASLNPAIDGYALTAELHNIIHTRATLYYHVEDPMNHGNVGLRTSASNTVQIRAGQRAAHLPRRVQRGRHLTPRRRRFSTTLVLQRVSDLVEQAQLGIVIDQCEVQSIPPRQLQDVFSMVTAARENRNKLLNDAHSYENQVLNESGAQAVFFLPRPSRTPPPPSARPLRLNPITARGRSGSAICCRNITANSDLFHAADVCAGTMETGVHELMQDKIYLPQRADWQTARRT